jgi:hypothetical protein
MSLPNYNGCIMECYKSLPLYYNKMRFKILNFLGRKSTLNSFIFHQIEKTFVLPGKSEILFLRMHFSSPKYLFCIYLYHEKRIALVNNFVCLVPLKNIVQGRKGYSKVEKRFPRESSFPLFYPLLFTWAILFYDTNLHSSI